MEIAGLTLTALDLCLKYGPLLVNLCSSWKNAGVEVAERLTIVENAWMKTQDQIIFVQRIAPSLDDEHRRVLDNTLAVLATKLSLAINKCQGVLAGDTKTGFLEFASKARRSKYVVIKSTLDEVIKEMEDWQRRFDPSWYLTMRIHNPIVDQALDRGLQEQTVVVRSTSSARNSRSNVTATTMTMPLSTAAEMRDALRTQPQRPISVFLPEQAFDVVEIPYCRARAARRKGGNAKWLIVDSIRCIPSSDVLTLTKDVRNLARKLTQADPKKFGLLSCKGVMRILEPSSQQIRSFDMIFRAPEGMEPFHCLREILLESEKANISLSARVRIAQQLATSVSYVHAFNFVHKNIRPESILVCTQAEAAKSFTFLVGFDQFRSADGGTQLQGDTDWARNLYRHPSRQGEKLVESYKMQHDIYSLGLCLLEVGLWESLVNYSTEPSQQPQPGRSLHEYREMNLLHPQPREGSGEWNDSLAFRLKDYLVDLAIMKLPKLMGDKYTNTVVTCLKCLDEGNEDFGDELEMADEDGILVGVRFIESTLLRLNEIIV
ncbi:hypothetical protein BKA65DRAFT_471628 [Rhexocercosporidium sp. MPI-PUGE-AT-0058]|nr:hypothetical protein BKA65DRAFT_471628 [Rhexocercosporidium sp. MPI-PUGE-AT-0058]